MSKVLVVTVPAAPDGDICQMRDYVKESLEQGVLVVGAGVQWELLELPELGGVWVQGTGGPGEASTPVTPSETNLEGKAAFAGCGAKEKRRIYERLRNYRDRHGLGSLEPLADAAGQELTVTELRDALLGHKLPMDTWRAIGAALSRLEPEN